MSSTEEDTVHDLSPPLEKFREAARQTAMDYFIEIAMRDQRPPTQRAMDAVKATEARLVLMNIGYSSDLLQREADLRSQYTGMQITQRLLAQMVDAEASKLKTIELQRVEAAVGIDAAKSVADIASLLNKLGIPMPARQVPSLGAL